MGRQVSYEKLLKLAHQRVIDGKGGLASSIAKMCLDQQADLSDSELALTYQILRQLIDKVEVQIRRHIADILAERDDVPRDLLAFLTNDAVHVAYPIIIRSQQLREEDLIALIARQSKDHAVAIATRPDISEAVCAQLVALRQSEIDITLLRNESAQLGRSNLEILVERSEDEEDNYQELVIKRPDMTDDLARKMYVWVGEALRHHISRNFDIDSDTVKKLVGQAVAQTLDHAIAPKHVPKPKSPPTYGRGAKGPGNELIQTMFESGADAFLASAARELDLSLHSIDQVFAQGNVKSSAVACKALGLNADQFITVLKYMRNEEEWDQFSCSDELSNVRSYFARIDSEGAQTVVEHWRQSPQKVNTPS